MKINRTGIALPPGRFRASKVLAVKLYEMGKLSSGRAAELAGISRISFLQSLAQFGAPIFDLTREELKRDLQNA